jgi:hypothetical protein
MDEQMINRQIATLLGWTVKEGTWGLNPNGEIEPLPDYHDLNAVVKALQDFDCELAINPMNEIVVISDFETDKTYTSRDVAQALLEMLTAKADADADSA